jgi:hypothetical protein
MAVLLFRFLPRPDHLRPAGSQCPPARPAGFLLGAFPVRNSVRFRALAPVPRFYFDVVLQGQPETDPVGIELVSRHVARQEAVRAAAELAKDPHVGENAKDITLAIREGEEPVATVRLSLKIEDAPAAGHTRI